VKCEQVAELDDSERLHRLQAQPIAPDLEVALECGLGQTVGDDPRFADASQPARLDGVYAAGSEK